MPNQRTKLGWKGRSFMSGTQTLYVGQKTRDWKESFEQSEIRSRAHRTLLSE